MVETSGFIFTSLVSQQNQVNSVSINACAVPFYSTRCQAGPEFHDAVPITLSIIRWCFRPMLGAILLMGKHKWCTKEYNKTNKQTNESQKASGRYVQSFIVSWRRELQFVDTEHAKIITENLRVVLSQEKKTVSPFLRIVLCTRPVLQSVLFSNSKGTAIYESREHQICFGFLFCL